MPGVRRRTAPHVSAWERRGRGFATAIRGATQGSGHAQLRADGKQAADRIQARSADAAFFGKIRTPEDVNTLLGPTLKEWLSPVNHHCS